MKHLKIVIVVVFLFCFNFDAFSQWVNIRVINRTGKAVDSLVVNNYYIGHLEQDSLSKITHHTSLTFDSGSPIFSLNAYIDNQALKNLNCLRFCGSELEFITKGDYLIYLKYRTSTEGGFLYPDLVP